MASHITLRPLEPANLPSQCTCRGSEGDRLFYAMEYVDGVSLRHCMERYKPSERRILTYGVMMCDARGGTFAACETVRDFVGVRPRFPVAANA